MINNNDSDNNNNESNRIIEKISKNITVLI